jgi:hypothetical protein
LMLQAAIGRVNARAGEERRIIPERDEKTLIQSMNWSLSYSAASLSVFNKRTTFFERWAVRSSSI